MRLGLFSFACRPEAEHWPAQRIIDLAVELGCEGIDWQGLFHASAAETAQRCNDAGLVSVAYTHFAGGLRFADQRAETLEQVREACETTQTLGAQFLMIPTPGHKDYAPADMRGIWIEALTMVAPIAADHGIQLCIETVPHAHSPMQHSDELLEVVAAVPGLGIAYDTGNGAPAQEAAAGIKACAEHVVYVHLKDDIAFDDAKRDGPTCRDGKYHHDCPIGTGMVDLAGVIAALRDINYQGFIMPEHNDRTYPSDKRIRHGTKVLKELLAG